MENYFWNTEEAVRDKKLYVLIIYDIVDNKKRNKFAKMMNGYGFRVQKSAFEAMISNKLYDKLLKTIPQFIDLKEDSVRVYKMRGSGEVKSFGLDAKPIVEDIIIL